MIKRPSGSTLIESYPFVHCLLIEFKKVLCDFCFLNSTKLLQCSSCKYMHYCGTDCQRKDWPIHKLECKSFKDLTLTQVKKDLENDLIRLYLRILIQINNDKFKSTDENGLKTFETLVDHYQDITNDTTRLNSMYKCLETIKAIMGVDFLSKFSTRELISFFGKMTVNTFTISNYDLSKSIGSGVYLSASSLNHSCFPNSVVTFNGTKIVVKAIRDLDQEEEPLISYTEMLMSRQDRQKYLQNTYYFKCKCSRCLQKDGIDDKFDKTKCKICKKCSFNLNDVTGEVDDDNDDNSLNDGYNNFKCIHCNESFSSMSYKNYLKDANSCAIKLKHFIQNLESFINSKDLNDSDNSKQEYQSCINQSKSLIENANIYFVYDKQSFTFNIYLVRMYELLTDLYIKVECFKEATHIAIDYLLDAYKAYFPNNHPSLGFLCLKISKLLTNQERLDEAKYYLGKAHEIIRVSHNQDHEIFDNINYL